jgi:hypothetical protein
LQEKTGITVSLPLTCGTCGTLERWGGLTLQWCAACGNAICPTCCLKGQGGLTRCEACIKLKRPTHLEVAGREFAERHLAMMEEAFWKEFMADDNLPSPDYVL